MKEKFKIFDAKLKDAQDYLRGVETAVEELSNEHHGMMSDMRSLKLRQVRASEDLALAKDMRGIISAEARYFKAQYKARKVGREGLQDRLGRYMQDKASKESRLRTIETMLQKDRLGASQDTADQSTVGPSSSGPPASSAGPDVTTGSTGGKRTVVYWPHLFGGPLL